MKTRRHHKNKGTYQIRHGYLEKQVKTMAKKLRLPYHPKDKEEFLREIFKGVK